MMLQFGTARPSLNYRHRHACFGLALKDGLLACVRVDRGEGSYYDLPGGAVDGDESEQQALVREFGEETGLRVQPLDRLTEAAQYFCKSNGEPINNSGGYWLVSLEGFDTDLKCEADHELVWLEPSFAMAHLRHEAHAWAVTHWLRSQV